MVAAFTASKWLADRHTGTLEQQTLATFISEGADERYLRRVRRRNTVRRRTLLDSIDQFFGDRVRVTGDGAGAHVVLWPVSPYFLNRSHRPGFLLGYSRFYIGTMSKILAPGIRIGFVAATGDFIRHLLAYRSILDLQGDQTLEHAVAELLEEGLVQRHVRKMRQIYRHRLDTLASELCARLDGFLTFDRPSGGTAIWVQLRDPRMLRDWTRASQRAGVVFDAADNFTLGGAVAGARLGFASLSERELRKAVSLLARAAEEVRSSAPC